MDQTTIGTIIIVCMPFLAFIGAIVNLYSKISSNVREQATKDANQANFNSNALARLDNFDNFTNKQDSTNKKLELDLADITFNVKSVKENMTYVKDEVKSVREISNKLMILMQQSLDNSKKD